MENQAKEDALGDKMVTALNNLAKAAVQKNDTFKQLVLAKKTLVDVYAARYAEVEKLIAIITALSKGTNTGRGGGDETTTTSAASIPWNPTGYCWLHGFKCKVGHNSANLEKCIDGHNKHITDICINPQGGCMWNKNWKK